MSLLASLLASVVGHATKERAMVDAALTAVGVHPDAMDRIVGELATIGKASRFPLATSVLAETFARAVMAGDSHSDALGFVRAGVVTGIIQGPVTASAWSQARSSGALRSDELRTIASGEP
jgi:hypothetical protein